jgi:hypothetical protein
MNYKVRPSTIKQVLEPNNPKDFGKYTVNSIEDLVNSEDPEETSPSNWELLFPEFTEDDDREDLDAAAVVHTSANQLLGRLYYEEVPDEDKAGELLLDLAEGEHETCPETKNQNEKLEREYGIDDILEIDLWGNNIEEKLEEISENAVQIKNMIDGDTRRPVYENFRSKEYNEIELRSLADILLKGYGEPDQIIELKIDWTGNEIPRRKHILQARATAAAQGAEKSYLIYANEGEAFEYTPLSQAEINEVETRLKPIYSEIEKEIGKIKDVNDFSDSEHLNIEKQELKEVLSDKYQEMRELGSIRFEHEGEDSRIPESYQSKIASYH